MPQSSHRGSGSDEIRIVPSSRPSAIGRVRTCRSVTAIEWVTIGVSIVSIVLGGTASIYRFATLPWDDPDIIFSILILLNLGFASFYIFHGIFQEQPFEMVALVMTLGLICILIIVNYFSGLVLQMKLIRLVITSVLTVPNIIFVLAVGWNYWESGNLIFKTVGGDVQFQRYCRQLFFAYSLLTFDVQAQLSCLVLALQQGFSNVTANQDAMLVFGASYTLVWVSIGYTAMRTENLNLTRLFIISSVVQPAYVVFLFTQAIDVIGFDKKYSVLAVAVYVSATLLVLAHFTLIAMTVLVSHNYGKGLKFKVYGGTPPPASVSTASTGSDPFVNAESVENYDAITPAP